MAKITSGTVRSADGTTIAFDRSGAGPPVIFVAGALPDRTFPVLVGLAAALAPRFTVFNYDRRGQGGSGDTMPYAVQREIEDIDALIREAGGSAMLLSGGNSPAWMSSAAKAVAGAVPGAIHRVLDDQSHSPAPESLAPELEDFYLAG